MSCEKPESINSQECSCTPITFAVGCVGLNAAEAGTKTKTRFVDFGDVVPGKVVTKCLDLKNEGDKEDTYSVKRISYMNEIYSFFNISKYNNITIKSKCSTTIKVSYSPLIEHQKTFDCFLVSNKEKEHVEKIFLQGHCMAPSIKSSTRRIYFIHTPNRMDKVQTFELRNISKITATFQFEVNETEDIFQIDIVNGQIQPNRSVYIKVTFSDKIEGLHYRRLVILIYKHEPIMIDLIGLCITQNMECNISLRDLGMYPIETQPTIAAYFNDYGLSEENTFPFRLSQNCIDFGRIVPSTSKTRRENDNIATTVLSNKMRHECFVQWYKDPEGIFHIHPSEISIRGDEVGYFEVEFTPTSKSFMYTRVMYGQIYWKSTSQRNTPMSTTVDILLNQDIDNIPIPVSLTLIGHTFAEDQTWISGIQIIPSKIIFPLCLPGYNVFATFMMKLDGHLPVLFKFIPPKQSNIVVKPSMGITNSITHFVAKLISNSVPSLYNEEWNIQLNGDPNKFYTIVFEGQGEMPSILIGKNNTVTFNTTLPCCQDAVIIPVKNTSSYHMTVKLIDKNEYFHTEPKILDLWPNDIKTTQWTFNGKLDVPNESEIICSMRVFSNTEEIIGLPYDLTVKLYANCEFTQLCSTPRQIEYGDLARGTTKSASFRIFNLGNSVVCFTLKAVPTTEARDETILSVSKGKLGPNENMEVTASFEATESGFHSVEIVYFTRINEFAEAVTFHPPVELFLLKYICIYPIIQIYECVEHNLGAIFSKLDIWNMLEIRNINENLKNVEEGETRTVQLFLPVVPCQTKTYKIQFLLKNITKFNVHAALTRVKMCQCEAREVSNGLSLRRKIFECVHRKMLKMTLTDNNIIGGSYQLLDVTLNFNIATNELVAYDLNIANDRHVVFCFKMNSISTKIAKISPYTNTMIKKFLSMSIGVKEPPFQSFWLYNNTSHKASYNVNCEEMRSLNEVEGFPIFSCLKESGVVKPYSHTAIFFKFHPIEAKEYQIDLPLLLGSEKTFLTLVGRGAYQYDKNVLKELNVTYMPKQSFYSGSVPVTLSADYMLVEIFAVWSVVSKLIYLRNVTKDKVIQYSWIKCHLEGIIDISPDKPTGLIHPQESIPILLTLTSYENPVITTINVSCKFIDVTQNEQHLKSIEEHAENQKIIEQCFVINETGTHPLENERVIVPPPEAFYLTIAVSFQTISVLEYRYYMNPAQYFQQIPPLPFERDIDDFLRQLYKKQDESKASQSENQERLAKHGPFISQILECLLIDILKNPIFNQVFGNYPKSSTPYYLQFKQDDYKNKAKAQKDRISELRKYFTKPTERELSNNMKDLIKNTLEQLYF